MAGDTLIILYSYHHRNTEKVAERIAEVMHARIISPHQISHEELQAYELIGFGSGIYSGRHHEHLLEFAEGLPMIKGKKVFIFSTFGAPKIAANEEFIAKNHNQLRAVLQSKGFKVIGEYGCAGLNTNGFLKLFGGINKGRPDAKDLKDAEKFAGNLLNQLKGGS